MEIDKTLYAEIKAYCEINGLKARDYIHTLLKKAFMEDKYGKMPSILDKKEIDRADEEYAKFVNNMGADTYNKVIEECIWGTDEASQKDEKPKIESEKKVVKTIKRKLNE